VTTVADVIPAPAQATARTRSIAWEKMWWVPLAVILAAQALYTIRLVPMGFASADEARYIIAGHQLIHEFWHGGGSPYYETYFSGAPVIYSPLAATADYLGGLAAVRLMSTVFMLTATALLFLTSRRLFGYWPAVMAAGLFAGLGLTQVVGRNTIYDAMAFMLVAFATYCAIRARDGSPRWLLLLPVALLAANATKYMTITFDPIIITFAALQDGIGWRAAARRAGALSCATVALLGLAAVLAGTAYLKGVAFTTLSRQRGGSALLGAIPQSRHVIVIDSWHWIGVTLVLAAIATLLALLAPGERRHLLILVLCLSAGLLLTAEALRLGSSESMHRHDDLSAWFASIAAGYAIALPFRMTTWRPGKYAVGVACVAAVLGSWAHYSQPPGTFYAQRGYDTANVQAEDPLYSLVRPYLHPQGQRYLFDGFSGPAVMYEDHVAVRWSALVDDNYIKYPVPGRGGDWQGQARGTACQALRPGCMYLSGSAGFRAAIHAHAFAMISITRLWPIPADRVIIQAVKHTPGYVLLTHAGGGPTWIYLPDYQGVR
jgi:4-amino-4-deoxy-L-arabinose transferase-like glycosyltransferase